MRRLPLLFALLAIFLSGCSLSMAIVRSDSPEHETDVETEARCDRPQEDQAGGGRR